jgi:putative protease
VPVDNEIGTVFNEEGLWKVCFKKLQTPTGKLFDEIHSGNINAIVLPVVLPGFTFLRAKTKG